MKLYKTTKGVILDRNGEYLLLGNVEWDDLINDDSLFSKLSSIKATPGPEPSVKDILPPVGKQEIWAAGVT